MTPPCLLWTTPTICANYDCFCYSFTIYCIVYRQSVQFHFHYYESHLRVIYNHVRIQIYHCPTVHLTSTLREICKSVKLVLSPLSNTIMIKYIVIIELLATAAVLSTNPGVKTVITSNGLSYREWLQVIIISIIV